MVERLTYGNTHTFLLQGPTSSILVDTGYAGTLQAFYKAIKAQDIKVSDITYWDLVLSNGPKRILYAHANEQIIS